MFKKTSPINHFIFTLIGLITPFYVTPSTQAQIGVSPLVIQESAQRGRSQGIINVRNTTNQPIRVRIYSEPFIYDKEKGFQTVASGEADLSRYLRFSPAEMVIPANAERKVRFLALLAPSLPDREYRAVIFSETLREAEDNQQSSVGIIARIGVTVYVTKGDLQPNLTPQTATYDSQENMVRLLVKNTGKATVLPKVIWRINQNGQNIARGETPETTVMAESERFIKLNLIQQDETSQEVKPVTLSRGEYQLTGQLVWQRGNNNPTVIPFDTTISVTE